MAENMILPIGENNGFSGSGWGPAVCGLIFGSLFGNGGFGWGGRGGAVAGQVGADVVIQSGLQNLQNAVQNGTVSNLQSSQAIQNGQNANAQAIQNSISQNTIANMQSAQQMSDKVGNAAMGVANQVAAQGMATTAAINTQTIQNLQGQANLSQQVAGGFANAAQQLCQCCNSMQQALDSAGDQITAAITDARIQSMANTQAISDKLCALNQNITNQGYENQLRTQQLSAQIAAENCQDRELMRQIATEALQQKLTETQAALVATNAEKNLTQQLGSTAQYLIANLKTTTATAGA